MNALLLRFRMRSRGAFKLLWRSCKTLEGAVRAFFTVGFLSLLLFPLAAVSFATDRPTTEQIQDVRFATENFIPLAIAFGLLVAFISPKSDTTLNFQPAEIDFLFTAPFTRRELLIFKLLGLATSTAVFSLIFTCLFSMVFLFIEGNLVLNFARGVITIFLAMLLMRLMFVWSGLVRRSIVVRLLTPLRKIVIGVVAILWLGAIYSTRDKLDMSILKDETKLLDAATTFIESDAYQLGIKPFRVFSNLLLSQSLLEMLFCVSLCLGAIAGFLWLIVKTDNNFLEKEIENARVKVEVLKRTQNFESMLVSADNGRSLPMLPFLGGIGPIAWRQLQTFFRIKKLLIFTVAFYSLLYLFLVFSSKEFAATQFRFSMGVASLAMITLTVSLTMPMGFQTDVKKMDIFKSLPFSKWHIAAGQLLGPTSMLVLIQYVSLLLFMMLALDQWLLWLTAFAFAPLFSVVILCVVNSISLLYPGQSNEGVARELENIGHILVFIFLMIVAAIFISGLLSGVGALAYFATHSIPLVVIACWFVMLFCSFVGVWLTGWAFGRFDVSKHRL